MYIHISHSLYKTFLNAQSRAMGELIHISHSLYKTYEAELDIRIETRFTYHIVYIKPCE